MNVLRVLNNENIKYVISAVVGGVAAYSGLWHTVNVNSINNEHQAKKITSQDVVLQEMSKDVIEIKIMLAVLMERQSAQNRSGTNANFQNNDSNTYTFTSRREH